MTPGAQAVYKELNGRRGILDVIDDESVIEEICEATAAAVLRAVRGEADEETEDGA
jgi:hypothetical protein